MNKNSETDVLCELGPNGQITVHVELEPGGIVACEDPTRTFYASRRQAMLWAGMPDAEDERIALGIYKAVLGALNIRFDPRALKFPIEELLTKGADDV